jgi:voltage-gated potassium channel
MASAALGRRSRTHPLRVFALYGFALLREFRSTIATIVVLMAIGTAVVALTPQSSLHGESPGLMLATFCSWMAFFGQVVFNPPDQWWVELLHGVYPIFGFVVLGEGVVRLALLMTSRRRGEREWMKVMASTFRGHVVVCGLGHLGLRVAEELVRRGSEVVAIEREKQGRFVPSAQEMKIPIFFADMRDDRVLRDAGIEHASAVVVATNDDMANLEVALDSRRMNPSIKVLVRFFDHAIATKIQGAFAIDEAFSSEGLAAPVIVDRALGVAKPRAATAS